MTPSTAQDLQRIEMIGVQTRLNEAEEQALLKVLREANSLATGPEGEALEKEFAAYLDSGDAVALSSCSSALELSAILTGLGEGDEVIIPAHTFVATAVPFGRTGATIKWADIDSETRNVSAESIESLISDKTKVIVAVHLYGLPCEMDAIMALADKHNIYVVEDCAQAPGARYKGKCVGSIGHFGCFSFHTHKNINTLGEGGYAGRTRSQTCRRLATAALDGQLAAGGRAQAVLGTGHGGPGRADPRALACQLLHGRAQRCRRSAAYSAAG